jgi:tRNA threonylcarbamoyladenosine biosynthesis protein TsaB
VAQEGPGSPPLVVAEIGVLGIRSHAGHVLGWIERLLAEAGWPKSSLDAFAAARGPGSFTGVRVGLGTIRGLGLASGRPCFGVGTLQALAEAHGPAEADRVPLVAAGRGELYAARFDAVSSPPIERESPWVACAGEVLERVARGSTVLVPAPGSEIDGAARPGAGGRFVPAPRAVAGAIGRLVALTRTSFDEPAPPLSPLYVRPPDVRVARRR